VAPNRALIVTVAATLAVAWLGGCGDDRHSGDWPLPNADLAGSRTTAVARIDSGNAASLSPRWRFRFRARPSYSGIFASTPIVDGDTVYVQDLRSNVFALDRAAGTVRWERRYGFRNDGPNGLASGDGRIYGGTDSEVFALDAATGRELWRRHLATATEQFVDVAPVFWNGLVFTGTVGYPPGGRGAVYAFDAKTGDVRWRFDTIAEPWLMPMLAGGGGIWYPVSIDGDGRLYVGTSNPGPWGGTPALPNGGAFPGRALYTDSLVVLDARSGRLLWHDQVTPHDVRDYDFEATPIIAGDRVIGAGKAGRVIAWDRRSRQRLWESSVGLHRNDVGPLPGRIVPVCPGLLGGVETPMAFADDRVFVPVVELCVPESAVTTTTLDNVDPNSGKGLLVALDVTTGKRLWERRFSSANFGCATVANDVVFTSTYDGNIYGLGVDDGRVLWRTKMRAGMNSCPAIAGDTLLAGAGVPRGGSVQELVAFSPD